MVLVLAILNAIAAWHVRRNEMRKMNKDELHNWLQNKSRKSRNKKKYHRPTAKKERDSE